MIPHGNGSGDADPRRGASRADQADSSLEARPEEIQRGPDSGRGSSRGADSGPRLRILIGETTEGWAELAAEHFIRAAADAIADRGVFRVVVPGGSTPRVAFGQVVATRAPFDWGQVHVYFGDERLVEPAHQDSNYRMMREALLDHVDIPSRQVHRIEAELGPDAAAAQYEKTLADLFGESTEVRFDLVILGLGPDGHVASLIPGGRLDSTGDWAGVGPAPLSPANVRRVTMTAKALKRTRELAMWVRGADKALVVRHALRGVGVTMVPEVEPEDGVVTWILDRPAAGEL